MNSMVFQSRNVLLSTGAIGQEVYTYVQGEAKRIATIISQRSCETDSNILSLLAYGLGSQYVKAGAPARERIVKYNELIRINSFNTKATPA